MAPSVVPVLRRADDHWSRAAAQKSARPTIPADLDSPRLLWSLPEDIYGAAGLVPGVRALQPSMPTTSVGTAAPGGWHLGAIHSRHRRRVAIAGPVYRATVGRTFAAPGKPVGGEALAGCGLQRLQPTHHP